jgi:flavodoxin
MGAGEIESVKIVYFSGTGGTKRAAEALANAFAEKYIRIMACEIRPGFLGELKWADLLVILFPVYAMNAPRPVIDWVKSIPKGNNAKVAVISVSGGGEISPNTACWRYAVRKFTRKGYKVIYENMLIMPSNSFIATPDGLSTRLIDIFTNNNYVIFLCVIFYSSYLGIY